jgi:nitrogen fixation protein FixH
MNDTKQPRSFWPIGIIAFFALALVFLVTFVIWASRQREDLVAQNYYDNEVRFQKQLDQMNRTQPLASQVAVAYDAVLRNIVITLPAAQAANAVGQIKLYRPSDAALDRSVPLAVNSNGVQQLDAKSLPAGLWKIRVQWSVDGEEYFLDRSIVVANQS